MKCSMYTYTHIHIHVYKVPGMWSALMIVSIIICLLEILFFLLISQPPFPQLLYFLGPFILPLEIHSDQFPSYCTMDFASHILYLCYLKHKAMHQQNRELFIEISKYLRTFYGYISIGYKLRSGIIESECTCSVLVYVLHQFTLHPAI